MAHYPDDTCTRRAWLRYGVGAFGLLLSGLTHAGDTRTTKTAARSCVFFLLHGGPSQLDTWDLKPDAPAEVRGEFRPIATSVPGLRVCEHLPQLARRAHRFSVVRSMTHTAINHNTATY